MPLCKKAFSAQAVPRSARDHRGVRRKRGGEKLLAHHRRSHGGLRVLASIVFTGTDPKALGITWKKCREDRTLCHLSNLRGQKFLMSEGSGNGRG